MYGNIHLTDREEEVLVWLVEGKTNKEIADQLDISADSVKQHLKSICEKLFARNRVQIAVIAVTLQLAQPRFNGLSEYHSPSLHSQPEPRTDNQIPFTRLEETYSLPPPPVTEQPPWDSLTEGEWNIFRLFAEDEFKALPNKLLALHLKLSIHTVKKYLRRIYEKTQCRNRIELASLAALEKEARKYRY